MFVRLGGTGCIEGLHQCTPDCARADQSILTLTMRRFFMLRNR